MQQITSAQNPTIKHLRKLVSSGQYRNEQQQAILEGVHLCQSYLVTGTMPQLCVAANSAIANPEVQQIIQATNYIKVPDSLFGSFSSLQSSVGLLFIINIPRPHVPQLATPSLLLDAVQDPGNLGTMLRTAAAAGLSAVYSSPGTASVWSPKTLRAGMGAHFTLNIYENADLAGIIQQASLPVYATSLQASQLLYDCDLTTPSAWLFGSEGRGVGQDLLDLCGQNTVIIPQNPAVESLNVAAAAAICLFEQRRQMTVQS